MPRKFFFMYIGVLSVLSVVICTYDKIVSKRNNVKLRIPESTLLALSALGGSAAMLIWMLIIRHKTKHPKFMLGIPVILALQIALVAALVHFGILTI